ncbi:Arabinosyltransferase [Cucurbita argyrosperma subsp. argyrosperma]|nr:Arabinosyltransferase [Cucurbita argyrosperma subsp. argyrosperma]
MVWGNGCQDGVNTRPLFLVFYATVAAGIVFSSLYVFSAVYSSSNFVSGFSSSWFSSNSGEFNNSNSTLIKDQTPNVSQPDVHNNGERPIWEAPNTKNMPSPETFRLTKELVQRHVKDNVIIVTFGNYAFLDFILNWVKHLTDLDLSNLLVGAMDTKLLEALYWKGIPVFDMGSHMSTVDVGWGSSTFHKMGREKNPLPYLARYPEADVLSSSDQVIPTVVDDKLDIWNEGKVLNILNSSMNIKIKGVNAFETVSGALNIGIFHWRPTRASKKLAKEWKEMLLADDKIWDQNGFNELVRKKYGPSVDEDGGLVYAYDGNLKLGILPASIFCSGHTFFVQVLFCAMYQQFRLEPYAVHTTFQYAGTEGKRHRLREAMVFDDPPEYFDAPGGYLSFKPSIPKSLLLEGEHDLDTHFRLMNYQLKQIRTALAIASLLNRVLVRTLESEGMLLSFVIVYPQLYVNVMLKELPMEEFGPGINFREYSFLDNPLLPKQVKESWLDVQLCKQESEGCHASNDTVLPGVLKFPKGSNEDTLKAIFSKFKDVKVIQFSTMQDAFPGFSDKKREEKFRNRVKRYVGIWCCVENAAPGHVFYDMYWDEKPDWKPHPPRTPEEDRPPL